MVPYIVIPEKLVLRQSLQCSALFGKWASWEAGGKVNTRVFDQVSASVGSA